MNIKRIIPDTITCCNLLCGCVAVYMATQGIFIYAFLFILAGAFFDFFDGMSARILKAPSPIGIQLDSLADDITFGLAPAMMLFAWLKPILGWWSAIALIMAAFAALRLAKFNVDERQTSSFIGLATPANAIFWGAVCCFPISPSFPSSFGWGMLGLSLISCYLMNAEIPFFSFKFHGFGFKAHAPQYLFLIGCIILIAYCVIKAFSHSNYYLLVFAGAACVLWYVAFNLLLHFIPRKK